MMSVARLFLLIAFIAFIGSGSYSVFLRLRERHWTSFEGSRVDFHRPFLAEFKTLDRSPNTSEELRGFKIVGRNARGNLFQREVADATHSERFFGMLTDIEARSVTRTFLTISNKSYKTVDYSTMSELDRLRNSAVGISDLNPEESCLKFKSGRPALGVYVGNRFINGFLSFGLETMPTDTTSNVTQGPACFRDKGLLRVRNWHAPALGCAVVLHEAHLMRGTGEPALVKEVSLSKISQTAPPSEYFRVPSDLPLKEPKEYLVEQMRLDQLSASEQIKGKARIDRLQKAYENRRAKATSERGWVAKLFD